MMKLSYDEKIKEIIKQIDEADAIVVGGASGMSTANGFDYYNYGPFFEKYFADFGEIYNESSCWRLFYHHYKSHTERWAYMARSGCVMLDLPAGQTYVDLHELIKDKDHYIITTNQDAQFSKVFDPEKIFTIQGDAHWVQCVNRCHDQIYPSDELLHRLNAQIVEGKIPVESVPLCPVCGKVMEPWVKSYEFHYSSYWHQQHAKYQQYLNDHKDQKVLFLALGIGNMTPEFIKNPFMNMTYSLADASLVIINKGETLVPPAIANKTIYMDEDILQTLNDLVVYKKDTIGSSI